MKRYLNRQFMKMVKGRFEFQITHKLLLTAAMGYIIQ